MGQAGRMSQAFVILLLHISVVGALVVRILLRPHREPTSRIAWVAVVAALPGVGVIAYLLLGETNVGRRNRNSMNKAIEGLPQPTAMDDPVAPLPVNYMHLFRVGT